MAKKTTTMKGAMPEAAPTQPADKQDVNVSARNKGVFTTTTGRVVDSVRIFPNEKTVRVQAAYGTLNPAGKNVEEKRANMKTLYPRTATVEQAKEYLRLSGKDKTQAKEYVLNAVYPYHMDDARFFNEKGTVGGRPVDYVNIQKQTVATLAVRDIIAGRLNVDGITAEQLRSREKTVSDVEALKLKPEDLPEKSRELINKWMISYGQKGVEGSRCTHLLTDEEVVSLKHRAVVTLKDNGKDIATVGAPMTKLDLAERVEQHVVEREAQYKQRIAHQEELKAAASKVDWSKFKFPEGVVIDKLRYFESKVPDRVQITGKMGDINISALLSVNESTAVRNNLATLEQAAMANNSFRHHVTNLTALRDLAAKEDEAVDIIVSRASDRNAKAFTPDQVKVLNDCIAHTNDPEERDALFSGLFEKAEPALANVNKHWVDATREELHDLAHGKVRDVSQGIKM